MATVTVFSGESDGHVNSNDVAYATARAGGTLTAADHGSGAIVGQLASYAVYVAYFNFDFSGSGVSAGATISNAVLSFCLINDNSLDDFTLEARSHDWGATLTTADYVAGASLSGKTLLASLTTAGILTGATNYNALTPNGTGLDDAIASALAVDGILRILVCSSRDTNNTTPTQNEYVTLSAAESADSDPKLAFDWVALASGGMGGVGRMARRYRFHGRRVV